MRTLLRPRPTSVRSLSAPAQLCIILMLGLLAAPAAQARDALLIFSDGEVLAGRERSEVVDPDELPRIKVRIGRGGSGNTFNISVPREGIVARDGSPMKGVRLRSPASGTLSLRSSGTAIQLQAQVAYTRGDGQERIYDVTVRGEWPAEGEAQGERPRIAIEARRPGQDPDEPPVFTGWLTGTLEIQP